MMKGFSEFAIAFCTVCIVLGGLSILIPSGSMTKTVKYIFSLIFLSVLLTAVLSTARFKPDFSKFESQIKYQDIKNENIRRQVFEEALKSAGVQFDIIDVETEVLSGGNVIIKKVTVYTNESAELVNTLIGGSNEYEVEVINE